MKVLVDTSVWVDFFNGFDSPEATTLAELIQHGAAIYTCGVVLAEVFQGLRDPASRAALEPYLRELSYVAPAEPDSYLAAAARFRTLRQRGVTIRSMVDCLIATLAAEHGLLLLAKDRDMRAILDAGVLSVRAAPLLR